MKVTRLLTFVYGVAVFFGFNSVPAAAQQNATGLLLIVDSTQDRPDAVPGDRICADATGSCTLRAAIDESNSDRARNVIIFDLPQPSTIDLTLGELPIQSSFDIVGPGARRLTIRRSPASGTPDFRIFHVFGGQSVIKIRGVTMTNGKADGGGAMFIENGGFVSVFDSAIIGNRAVSGGALSVFGQGWFVRCLFESNIAEAEGGAVRNSSLNELTILGSTITNNRAATGGAISNDGNILVANDTISRNSASLGGSSIRNASQGTVRVINTIIGRDSSSGVSALEGAFYSAGNNIVTNVGSSTGFTNGVNRDQVSQNNAIDPLLGDLGNNGGQTDTMALLNGSPALDNGNGCIITENCGLFFASLHGITKDQRHLQRPPAGGRVDIGAFELEGMNPAGSISITMVGNPFGPARRFVNTTVTLIDPTTLERHFAQTNVSGGIRFQNVPSADVYIVHTLAKRVGHFPPMVMAFD